MYSGMMHSAKTSDPMLITFLVKDPSDWLIIVANKVLSEKLLLGWGFVNL
jgi:hypothetical protein